MQRHIGGFWGYTSDRSALVLGWAIGNDHDHVVDVQDVTKGIVPSERPRLIVYKNGLLLSYPNRISGLRTLRITFVSGKEISLNVFAASGTRDYSQDNFTELSAKLDGTDKGLGFKFGASVSMSDTSPVTYALMPVKDPQSRFDLTTSWTQRSQNDVFMFSSSIIKKLTGKGTVSRNTREEQFIQFAAVLGASDLTAAEVWDAVFSEESPTATGFIWADNLTPEPEGNARTFEVCFDPNSPSYYRTTGDDSAGNTIPTEYLNGTLPARFVDGGCPVPSYVQIAVVPTKESAPSAADGSITVLALSSSVTPRRPDYLGRDAKEELNYPNFPALSSQDFTYRLILNDGTTLTSGLVTASSHTFSGLSNGLFPITVKVEEDLTGEEVTAYTRITDEPQVRTPSDVSTIGGYTDRNEAPSVPKSPCFCGDAGAINFQGGVGDPCGICFECVNNALTQGGNAYGGQLITGQIQSVLETTSGSDGQVFFNGQLNQTLNPSLNWFILNSNPTYDIYLFEVIGNGFQPTTSSVDSALNSVLPNASFNGLSSGWYMLRVIIDGYTCHSNFWVFVPTQEQSICQHTVDILIYPCTGLMKEDVNSDAVSEGGYVVSVNGVQVETPYQVGIGDVITVEARLPFCTPGTQLFYSQTVTEADLQCPELPSGPVGCMDPTAINFDPTAQISSGICYYSDNIPHPPVCDDIRVQSVTVSSNIPTVNFYTPQSNYSVLWESPSSGFSVLIEDDPTGPYLEDGAYVVTVTFHDGCQEVKVIGVNVDPIYGCMDTTASNFLPSATIPYHYSFLTGDLPDSDPCKYIIPDSPCIPPNLQSDLKLVERCIEKRIDSFHVNMSTGRLSECWMKDLRTLMLIHGVLSKRGLQCVFNCQDSSTPSPQSRTSLCEDRWKQGGPSGNDLLFDPAGTYSNGDIVLHPDGNYYTFTGLDPMTGTDPLVFLPDNPWKLCRNTIIPPGKNVLDSYLAFIHGYCDDCRIVPSLFSDGTGPEIKPSGTTIDNEPFTIDGQQIEL